MTRIQYKRGLLGDYVYAARSRHGLQTFGNPFGETVDADGNLCVEQCHPWLREWTPVKVDHLPEGFGAIELFRALLRNPDAYDELRILAPIRDHMRAMQRKVLHLRPDAALACWCALDQDCHVDVIIEYYRSQHPH